MWNILFRPELHGRREDGYSASGVSCLAFFLAPPLAPALRDVSFPCCINTCICVYTYIIRIRREEKRGRGKVNRKKGRVEGNGNWDGNGNLVEREGMNQSRARGMGNFKPTKSTVYTLHSH